MQQGTVEHAQKLDGKENEIGNLRKIIEGLQDEMRELYQSKSNELANQSLDLGMAHERTIASLKAEHDSVIADMLATHSQELAKARDEAKSSRQLLEQDIQSRVQAHEAATTDRDRTIAELTEIIKQANGEHQSEVQSLNEKLGASEQKIGLLEKDLEAERVQVSRLGRSMETFQEASKGKDEHNEMKIEKLNAEMAEATANFLDEKSRAEKRHSEEFEELKTAHATELEDLKKKLSVSHQAKQELQDKYDALAASKSALEKSREMELESLEAEIAAMRKQHTDEIATLSESYNKATADQKKEFEEVHAKQQRDLKDAQAEISAIAAAHSKANEDLRTAHEIELTNQKTELESAVEKLAVAEQNHSSVIAELGEKRTSLSKVQEEKDALAEELKAAHAHSESIKSESVKVKEELALAEDRLEQQRQAYDKAIDDLKASKSAAVSSEEKIAEVEAKLAGLKNDMETLGEKNITLVVQVQEAEAAVSKGNRRIRELESDLAEAKAQKSDSPNLSNGAHVTTSGGLQDSKWATLEQDGASPEKASDSGSKGLEEIADPAAVEGEEDLGSFIDGKVGSPHFFPLEDPSQFLVLADPKCIFYRILWACPDAFL